MESPWQIRTIQTDCGDNVVVIKITAKDISILGNQGGNQILRKLIDMLYEEQRAPKYIVVNLSQVEEMCSAFLGTMIDLIDKYALFGGALLLSQPSLCIKEAFDRCKVSSILDKFGYEDDLQAVKAVPNMKGVDLCI